MKKQAIAQLHSNHFMAVAHKHAMEEHSAIEAEDGGDGVNQGSFNAANFA